MAGIALGIAALIVVLSVFNGFQKEVRARILGVTSHVTINGFENGLADWQRIADAAKANPEVRGVAPFVMGQGLLTYSQSVRGVGIRGIDPVLEPTVADMVGELRIGKLTDLQPGTYGIVLGAELSRALQAPMGTKIQLVIPQASMTPAGMVPRLRSFTVVGIFSSGHYEYDLNLALIHIKDAQVLYRLEDNVSGLRLKISDPQSAPLVSRSLAQKLKVDGYVSDWTRDNAQYFRAVQIERRMQFLVLTLIMMVATFNLVSTLVMVVTDKHPDIAILRTLGASPGTIMRIFIVQGAMVGLIGTVIGVVLGVVLAFNISAIVSGIESLFGLQILSKEIYFISELPSDLHWNDVTLVGVMAFVMSLVATLYPSWRASKVNPAEALRYE